MPYVTSPFGWRFHPIDRRWKYHAGIDIRAAEGSPVLSAASGVVVRSDRRETAGNGVAVRIARGITVYYLHLRDRWVDAGDRVHRGEQLGTVGHTGRVTGPHLHFAIHTPSGFIDPVRLYPRGTWYGNTSAARQKGSQERAVS